MKATIDGITYEGTPEEISAMMIIQASQRHSKPFKQPLQGMWGLSESLRVIEEFNNQRRYDMTSE